MYSLILTVESIYMVANGLLGPLLKQYTTQTEAQFEQESDYAIPSLIWPPPTIKLDCINTRSAQPTIYILLTGGVRHD